MALTLCELIEQWIKRKRKLKNFKIAPVVRSQGQLFAGDIMLWLPDTQRFPVGYIKNDCLEIFVPSMRHPGYHGSLETDNEPQVGQWKMLHASDPNFFKDLEEQLLLIASKWK